MAASGMTRAKYRERGSLELNVRLPKRLLEAIDAAAAEEGMSRREFVEEWARTIAKAEESEA